MSLARYIELTEQIEFVLAGPMPPPAEMHLLRETLFALVYARLGEVGAYSDVVRDERARELTSKMVDQRTASYVRHLREQITPAPLNYMKVHTPGIRRR
jgi:hypothetical protein